MIVILKHSGGIRLTVKYKKLNKLSIVGQLPVPRVDEVRQNLGIGRIFSLVDLVSSCRKITVHRHAIHPTTVCSVTSLFERLGMPHGSSATPGWFVKVITEAIKGLDRVAAYLDNDIVFEANPSLQITNMK